MSKAASGGGGLALQRRPQGAELRPCPGGTGVLSAHGAGGKAGGKGQWSRSKGKGKGQGKGGGKTTECLVF